MLTDEKNKAMESFESKGKKFVPNLGLDKKPEKDFNEMYHTIRTQRVMNDMGFTGWARGGPERKRLPLSK